MQDGVEMASAKRERAAALSMQEYPGLGPQPEPIDLGLHFGHGAQSGVEAEDRTNGLSFLFVGDELAISDVIPERDIASHPHALLLRGGKLVPDALAGDLALELRERQKHIESEAPHRGRGVECLRHRHE